MNRRTMKIAAGAAALALILAACGSDAEESAVPEDAEFEAGTTQADLAEAGTIRVGIKFDQPGFGLQGLSGEYEGFDVEIAKIIAAGLGIEPEGITFSEAPSAVREQVLENDAVDMVVATYTINEERNQRVSFAGPYYSAGQQLMVAAGNDVITSPENLAENPDQIVCSVTGSTPSEQIREYLAPGAELVLFDDYSACADALGNGQVDVVTTDNVILLGFVAESNGAYKLVGEQFTEEPYGIGISKGDVEFCDFINDQLRVAAESGAYQEAWENTAGQVEGTETPTLPNPKPCS